MDRHDYAKLPVAELKRRLQHAEDRMSRADTMDSYLADMSTIQELEAALFSILPLRSNNMGI